MRPPLGPPGNTEPLLPPGTVREQAPAPPGLGALRAGAEWEKRPSVYPSGLDAGSTCCPGNFPLLPTAVLPVHAASPVLHLEAGFSAAMFESVTGSLF